MAKKNNPKVAVNYPKLNERIASEDCTFRIETKLGGPVELSVDDGPWRACRPSIGYWCYDWKCAAGGKHEAVARVRLPDGGKPVLTYPRRFRVVARKMTP